MMHGQNNIKLWNSLLGCFTKKNGIWFSWKQTLGRSHFTHRHGLFVGL